MALRWLLVALAVGLTFAQAPSSQQSQAFTLTTEVTTITEGLPTGTASHSFTSTTFIVSSFTTLVPISTSTTASTQTTSSPTPTPTPTPVQLDTHVDPAFGVLGALLILTGIPSAFMGHKNRWSSFFIVGFYTLALITLALILKFGVLNAINPPSRTLRGLFVLSCTVAGAAGGGFAIFFWKVSKYFIGAWGGFAIALWIQCFRDGGLIHPIGFRWLFFIACATVGFVVCTIPKWHWHVLLISTAFAGASSFMLGVDCFSSAGLKEFYIWNLGFDRLFPKFDSIGKPFPVNQVMQIELGLIPAVFLMGASVQFRILVVLRRKLREINEEEKRREMEAEAAAAERFENVQKDLDRWEKDHGRNPSTLSGIPLLMEGSAEGSTPGLQSVHDGPDSSQFSLPFATRAGRHSLLVGPEQPSGTLPALDLGSGIKDALPRDFVADEHDDHVTPLVDPELQHRNELLAEIQTIRRSIDALRSTSVSPRESFSYSEDARPRHQSFSRALAGLSARYDSSGSQDRQHVQSLTTSRHLRTNSTPMDPTLATSLVAPGNAALGLSINRPRSTPLMDESWDAYTRERKIIVQPSPSTTPAPLAPTPRRTSLFAVPAAVSDALLRRHKKEASLLEGSAVADEPESKAIELGALAGNRDSIFGRASPGPSEIPIPRPQHRKTGSFGTVPPQLSPPPPVVQPQASITILPPARQGATPPAAGGIVPSRTHTFEELDARHRQKLRTLQDPLSRAEKEQANIDAARARWEKSKTVEKGVMARKEADALARAAKEEKERGREKRSHRRSKEVAPSATPSPHRSHSADKLAGPPAASRRMSSSLKVQEWQRYQHDAPATSASKRDARASVQTPDVPFPANAAPQPSTERRRAKNTDSLLRHARQDPPS